MEDKFKLLECDDDVVSFPAATFKVCQLKEQLRQKFQYIAEVSSLISNLRNPLVELAIAKGEINWKVNSEKDCQFLRLGSKSWQTGKLIVQLHLETFEESSKNKIMISLKFCPDEPEISQPESPLDDIRRMINEDK